MPRDKTDTHRRLIPCIREEFLLYGYERASLKNIARNAGITAAGLYRHFPSKEAMFAAMVEPVTGANGSGKTSFLRTLCGLNKGKRSGVRFEGKEISWKKRRDLCAMTMQDVAHQLFSDSVWDEFSLLNCEATDEEIRKISEGRIIFVATHDRELLHELCTRELRIEGQTAKMYDFT